MYIYIYTYKQQCDAIRHDAIAVRIQPSYKVAAHRLTSRRQLISRIRQVKLNSTGVVDIRRHIYIYIYIYIYIKLLRVDFPGELPVF